MQNFEYTVVKLQKIITV